MAHGLYGLVTKGLYAAGAHSAVSFPEPLTAAQKNLAALHDLAVFEPWFLLGACCFCSPAAGSRAPRRDAAGGRFRLIAGTALAVAFGVTLAVARKHFAVS